MSYSSFCTAHTALIKAQMTFMIMDSCKYPRLGWSKSDQMRYTVISSCLHVLQDIGFSYPQLNSEVWVWWNLWNQRMLFSPAASTT